MQILWTFLHCVHGVSVIGSIIKLTIIKLINTIKSYDSFKTLIYIQCILNLEKSLDQLEGSSAMFPPTFVFLEETVSL